MARLAIDVGNTQIKWAVFEGMTLVHSATFEKNDAGFQLIRLLRDYEIDRGLASATGHFKNLATLIEKKGLSIALLGQDTPVPFKNLYGTPETLGTDRIALAAAAALYFKNKNTLIIDAGTCVTYDFKNSANEYLGGAISPGLDMRYRSVHEFTARLPRLQPRNPVAQLLGKTTEEALHSGISGGLVNEIRGAIAAYSNEYRNLQVVLTGGDAQFLANSLKNGIFAPSNFLLEGLNYIMDFNTNQ
ncbi:MAG: type III pantothenate kinase [Leeuwenhoekiella sp.]